MKKPRLLWLNIIVFASTTLGAVTLVPWHGFTQGYDLSQWLMMLLALGFCGMSITAGYHRLWSHKTYQAHPVLRFLFALGGAFAVQNSVMNWAADHRRHHQHVDDDDRDPYSAGRGVWFSHMGWMLRAYPSGKHDYSNIQDLQRDKIVVWQHKYYALLALLMNFGIPLLLGWWHGDIIGTLLLVGVLRLVLSHHTTFLINSLAHLWGRQPYSEASSARDNSLLALLTYGEGYHNYHHSFQYDYRNGVRWWQFDPTKWLIFSCSKIGLTTGLKRIPRLKVERVKLELQFKRAMAAMRSRGEQQRWVDRLQHEYEQLSMLLREWSTLHREWSSLKREQWQQKYAEAEQNMRQKYQQLVADIEIQLTIWRSYTAQFV